MSGSNVTPFLRLQKPPFDSAPWDDAVNGNMDIIDAFVAQYMSVPNYMGAWANDTNYIAGQNVLDVGSSLIYQCQITHLSSPFPALFSDDYATHPEWWKQIYTVVSGAISVTVSDTVPTTANEGDFWFDSIGTQLYIRYNDGNSLQWVATSNVSANVPEAPNDGHIYGRQNGRWVQIG